MKKVNLSETLSLRKVRTGLMALVLLAGSTLPQRVMAYAPSLSACEVIANQQTWRVRVEANYDYATANDLQESAINQAATYDVIFEQHIATSDKVDWFAKSASGNGSIFARTVHHNFSGGPDEIETDRSAGAPVMAHGLLRLDRINCTYNLWVEVSANATTIYSTDPEPSEHLDSPLGFRVKDRAVPNETAANEVPTFGSAEFLPVNLVTAGDPDEFLPAGASGGVRAIASANGYGNAGNASVSWRMIPSETVCATRRGTVIDASDPILKRNIPVMSVALTQDEAYVLPNGKAHLRGYVACDGVPVSNARVFIVEDVYKKSGAHQHGGADRPLGYMNGKKLTQADSHIELTSDALGRFSFEFEPGRDTLNERIGISGEYHFTANLPDFFLTADNITLNAKVPDLVPLNSSNVVYWNLSTRHGNQNHYGTPATVRGIEAFAKNYYDGQRRNNLRRQEAGKPVWPTVPMFVNDISLPWGGLFDEAGFDSVSGGYRGANWQPPHYTHTDGKEVDFSVRPMVASLQSDWSSVRNDSLTQAELNEMLAFYRLLLRSLGIIHGSWISKQTYTLRVYQNFATTNSINAGPDPEVMILPTDVGFEANPVVVAGQAVSFTLAATNMQGSVVATGATVRATLHNGLTFGSASPAPSRMENGQPVWEIGTLITDSAMSMIALTATVGNGLSVGTPLTITASISGTNGAANATNSSDATAVYVQSLGPDLAVQSDLEETSLRLGKTTPFSVTVSNGGTAAANGKLVVQLPLSATFKSALPSVSNNTNNKTLEWDLGSMSPNTSRTVVISVEVKTSAINAANPSLSPLHFEMSATAASDLFNANNTLSVDQIADNGGVDLGMNLLMPDSAKVGEVFTLTVPYLNRSTQAAPSPVLSITWDSNLALVDAQLITSSNTASNTVITPSITSTGAQWAFAHLPAGADGIALLHLRALSTTPTAISANLTSDAFDPTLSDNLRTRSLLVAQGSGGGEQVKVYLPTLSR